MAQRAYVGLGSIAQEALALNQLYKTITLEMKCRCIDRNCKTVSDAVDIIERYEGILGDQSLKKPNVRAVTNDTVAVTKENEMLKLMKDLIERMDRLEKNQTHNDKTCFQCKKPGHFYKNCPWNTGRNNATARNDNRRMPPAQRTYPEQRFQEFQGNGNPSSH